jgi:hypothetical protein
MTENFFSLQKIILFNIIYLFIYILKLGHLRHPPGPGIQQLLQVVSVSDQEELQCANVFFSLLKNCVIYVYVGFRGVGFKDNKCRHRAKGLKKWNG